MATTTVEPQLRDAHESERLIPYLRDLWSRRSYIRYVSTSELRNRQITTVLGNFWHLLNPALQIAVYYVIFGLVLKVDRGIDNFILFLTVGIFVYQYTQRATVDGAKSIVGNIGLLKAIKFPRAMLPITSTVTETLSSLPTFLVVFAVALLTGQSPRASWLLFPVLVAVQLVFNMGASMVAARATTHFRDITQILPFAFRLLLYGSGVIFSAEAYATGRYSWVFTINPIYGFVTIARWCVMGGSLDVQLVPIAVAWSVVLLVGGFLWFRAAEERYARD
jgi:teichoic acid transport system permease protein